MHIYNYYANMSRAKGCGEEVTLKKGGKALMVHPNKDYRIRLVVKLNSPGASHFRCSSGVHGPRPAVRAALSAQLVHGLQHAHRAALFTQPGQARR